MFHLIAKLGIGLILPLICISIEHALSKAHSKPFLFKKVCLKWLCFWIIGFGAISAGMMQMFNPSYTANLLHVTMDDYIIIRELGCAEFGIGLVALLSFKWTAFRKPATMTYGVFIFGCTIIHLFRLSVIDFGEIVSTLNDIWILIVAVLIVANNESTGDDSSRNPVEAGL